jgi:hypothetical protein
MNGLCRRCRQPKNSFYWCQCNFQQNFRNWTSGTQEIYKFIQKAQLKAKVPEDILEWIEYDRFENVEYLAEGGFGNMKINLCKYLHANSFFLQSLDISFDVMSKQKFVGLNKICKNISELEISDCNEDSENLATFIKKQNNLQFLYLHLITIW